MELNVGITCLRSFPHHTQCRQVTDSVTTPPCSVCRSLLVSAGSGPRSSGASGPRACASLHPATLHHPRGQPQTQVSIYIRASSWLFISITGVVTIGTPIGAPLYCPISYCSISLQLCLKSQSINQMNSYYEPIGWRVQFAWRLTVVRPPSSLHFVILKPNKTNTKK